jgi:PAS domain S-box-containing protein
MDTIHTLHTKSKEDLIQEVMQLRSQIAELSHQPQPMLVEQTAESSPAHQLARSNGRPISDSFADRRVPQYQGIFDASREAIFIFSMDEIILDTNQSAELIYQCPKSELIGLSAEQFCRRYGMDYHSIITALREAALSGEPKLEWEGRTPDGRYMFREVVFRKGKYMGQDVIISYGRDISDRKIAEKTIQESESRFRTIADHAPVLLRLSDETNEFYYFSKQWLQFTGRTLKKEINAGWTKCIHPDDYPMVAASLENAFRKRKNFEITYRLKRKDGSYRWLLDKGVPYFGSDHQFKGFISSAIDITERKTAEEAKQKEEAIRNADETFQRALEDINLAGIRVEKDGTISFCNAFLLQALGYERDELLGKCFFDLLVPAYEREVRREEFARALKNGGFFDTMERSLLTKDGRVRYVQFSSVVLNSHQGEISGITRIGEDITDKKKVAEVLARNQAQLQDLFDNSNDLIQIISLRGDVLFVNKAWKEKLGYKDHEIENLNMKDIVHPDYGKATLRRFRKILRGEKLFKFQTVFVSKEGKNIYLEGSVSCKYESGRPTAFRCILYDITDKIRAEKAQNLYYSIASLTIRSDNLENLYQNIHQELGKVIEVKNFYITLYNQEKNYLHFPYYVDEDFGGEVRLTQRRVGKGLTEYAMLHSQPLFLYEEDIRRLAQENNLEIFGAIPKVWLGVPMKIEGRITGYYCRKMLPEPQHLPLSGNRTRRS